MHKEITIENFKCFSEKTKIPPGEGGGRIGHAAQRARAPRLVRAHH